MRQLLQNIGNGQTALAELPCPQIKPGHLLIRTHCSLISSGTERMAIAMGKTNLLERALKHPAKVKKALDMMRTDGVLATWDAVKGQMDHTIPLGYCNVGTVIGVGQGVQGFQLGDRVASNGPHAEVVVVAQNLCAKVPNSVSDDEGVFTVLASIGLHGIRLLEPTLGEVFGVTGLGPIGLLAIRLLQAQGCRVLAMDYDPQRLKIAQEMGATVVNLAQGQDPKIVGDELTENNGLDGVLITAATDSNQPIEQAADLCRKKGRIVLTGVTGLNIDRTVFFNKELRFMVSCSYGPGRYDQKYEGQGLDYPLPYVRWTEQRNFSAILSLMEQNRVNASELISHRFEISQVESAYDLVTSGEPQLGILLNYPRRPPEEIQKDHIKLTSLAASREGQKVKVGMVGVGNYAETTLVPAIQSSQGQLVALASPSGLKAYITAKARGIPEVFSNCEGLLNHKGINTLVICTRHDSHCDWILKGIDKGMNLFVEKPLCINRTELARIQESLGRTHNSSLMIGFNRRFSPLVQELKPVLSNSTPGQILMTVNAGAIPPDHWTQDPHIGGGRLVGEACHFVDLARYLAGAKIEKVEAYSQAHVNDPIKDDNFSLHLTFANQWSAQINYWSTGNKAFPKERIEVFNNKKIYQIDNFTELKSFGGGPNKKLWRQDKGQKKCFQAFVSAIEQGQASPISLEEIYEVTEACFTALEQVI